MRKTRKSSTSRTPADARTGAVPATTPKPRPKTRKALEPPALVVLQEDAPAAREAAATRRPGARTVPARVTRRRTKVSVSDRARLQVLMVAAEAVPFAKSGGLADVTGALPQALARLGHDVTLVVPRHRGVETPASPRGRMFVDLGPQRFEAALFEQPLGSGARVWFVDQPHLFDREALYGPDGHDYPDNPLRFAFLAKAALAAAARFGLQPDVVHAHDWHAGLVPVYLRTAFHGEPAFERTGAVFTIHNLSYQGLCDATWLPALGLGPELMGVNGLEYWGRISLLKGGINFADRLTTVSPRYAEEIQTPAGGFGFDGIVRRRADALRGILNGIDTDRWDPATDPHIPRPYSRQRMAGKRDAKRALLDAYGLPADASALKRPLIGMVSRMVPQKGLDLIAALAEDLPHLGATFVVHGEGESRFAEMWLHLAAQWPDRIGVKVGYQEPLAHLIEAGSDLWLMPSLYEPCGLSQIYSQRYGTVPVVRATGGLDDTVEDYDPITGAGSGFKFDAYEPGALRDALRRALAVFAQPTAWRRLQLNGMRKDFSWEPAARAYVAVYAEAMAAAPAATGMAV